MSLLDDLKRQLDMVRDLPPAPKRFLASHLVPYGGVFRQWNTRGELEVWVNRGQIADLPRPAKGLPRAATDLVPYGFGVPVVNVEREGRNA